jgi:hypothetical protein
VAERKPFLLRIDADLYAALARWADDEMRSLNGQIEFLLRRALAGAAFDIQVYAALGRPCPGASEVGRGAAGGDAIDRRTASPAIRRPCARGTTVRGLGRDGGLK